MLIHTGLVLGLPQEAQRMEQQKELIARICAKMAELNEGNRREIRAFVDSLLALQQAQQQPEDSQD